MSAGLEMHISIVLSPEPDLDMGVAGLAEPCAIDSELGLCSDLLEPMHEIRARERRGLTAGFCFCLSDIVGQDHSFCSQNHVAHGLYELRQVNFQPKIEVEGGIDESETLKSHGRGCNVSELKARPSSSGSIGRRGALGFTIDDQKSNSSTL